MSFFESIGASFIAFIETYWLTCIVFAVSCIAVGCLVEVFKIALFTKMEEKYKDNPDKLAKLKTIKAGCAFALAALLCVFFLACIYKDEALPKIGGVASTPIWYAAMFVLQMLCDLKGLKAFLGKIFGKVVETPKVEKEPKAKKKKVKMKKQITWVPVEDEDEE